MRNTKKKGFTIIELVVVVAVIAILAAVLIPTFSGILARANRSADEQTVANMNKYVALAAENDERVEANFEFAANAVNALYENGFNMGKFETYSKGYHYAYDLENNKFYLLNENAEVVFPKNAEVAVADLWGFFNNDKANKIVDENGDIKVTNYIALAAIGDANLFNAEPECVFGSELTPYTIDLNGKAITVKAKGENKNITLVNGFILKDVAGTYTTKETVTQLDATAANAVKDIPPVGDVVTIEDKLFTSNSLFIIKDFHSEAKSVVFKNCVFDFSAIAVDMGISGANLENITLENCSINLKDKNVYICGNDVPANVTIKGCTISSGRGLIIGGRPAPNEATVVQKSTYGEILIENNTFIDNGTKAGKPSLQFAASTDNNNVLTANKITIKGNTFICSDTAIAINDVVHEANCSNIVISNNMIPAKAVAISGDTTKASKDIAAIWEAKMK